LVLLSKFENIAIGTLNLLDKRDNSAENLIVVSILLQTSGFFVRNQEISTLRMAFECDCRRFLSQLPVKNLLDRIWKFGLNDTKVLRFKYIYRGLIGFLKQVVFVQRQ
jgi:hypothetical protein